MNTITAYRADYIFELVAKFAGYGFNKSHAAAYAVIAYQTAYLKANCPVEFLAASMSLESATPTSCRCSAAKLGGWSADRAAIGKRERHRFAVKDSSILYSLAALKNVGQGAIEHW